MPRHPGVLLLLLLFASIARAEFPVTEERPFAPMLGFPLYQRVVATDDGFLAFWKTYTRYGFRPLNHVAKLSREGTLVRRTVAWDIPDSFVPYDAASNGVETIVTGTCNEKPRSPLCLARFSPAGDFVGLIETGITDPSDATVGSNGDGFLVVFARIPEKQLVALPVGRDGAPSQPIVIGQWDTSSGWGRPAAIGSSFFVVLGTGGEYRLARLSSDGVDATVPLPSTAMIAASGDRLLVVAGGVAVFDRDLSRLTDWVPLGRGLGTTAVTPTTHGWLVATRGPDQPMLFPVTLAGVPGPPAYVAGMENYDFNVASKTDRMAVVGRTATDFTIPDTPFTSARIAVFDASASLIRGASTLSLGPAPQIQPAAAHGGGVTLAAWVERTIEERFVVKARAFDRDGIPLGNAMTMPWHGSSQTHPSVASDGASSFFITWSQGDRGMDAVYGARVAADGNVLDAGAIQIFENGAPSAGDPRTADVAWSGDAWIVVSTEGENAVVTRRVSAVGSLLEEAPAVIAAGVELGGSGPRISCNGNECLVAWKSRSWDPSCGVSGCVAPPPAIFAARLSPALALLDPAPSRVNGKYEWASTLSVSWNELVDSWSVAWSIDGRRRITRAGVILDELLGPSFYAGAVSAIPQSNGWHLEWTMQYGHYGGKVFHGWSPTGGVRDVQARFIMTRSGEWEWDPELVAAARPLAFVARETELTPASPAVIGRFLDEATRPVSRTIQLSGRRLAYSEGYFSWTTEADIVISFTLWELLDGEWRRVASSGPNQRTWRLSVVRASAYRITAETPDGVIESNVVQLDRERRRTLFR